MSAGWLSSIRVIDLSSVGPASRASGILAGYGADVLKVARPARLAADSIEVPDGLYGGRQPVTVRLDLATDAGRGELLRLAEHADVLLESFRPGVAASLGIDASAIRGRNHRLVYCSTSGYGRSGPAAGWAGHDLNYVGMSGLLASTEPRSDGGPPVLGATLADAAGGGMHAVIAILAALFARQHTGEGATLDVSATDGTLWLMAVMISQHISSGTAGDPAESPIALLSGDYACYQNYRAGDGKWLSVAAIEPRFWRNLCEAVGTPELVALQFDSARQPEVRRRLTARFASRDRDEWVALLAPADTCVAPVNDLGDVVHDPQFRARGLITDGPGDVAALGPLLAGMARPQLVEDLGERLRGWGLDEHDDAAHRAVSEDSGGPIR